MKEITFPFIILDDYPNEQIAWRQAIEEAEKHAEFFQLELVNVRLQRSYRREEYMYLFRLFLPV